MSRTKHHHHRQMHWAGPGWFHTLTTERPARAKTRRLERKAVSLPNCDSVDRIEWPSENPRRPHVYYW